jgi:hypothetical protein
LDGTGIESQWGTRFSTSVQTGLLGLFLGDKAAGGVTSTTHLHLAQRLKKEYSCTSTPPQGLHGLLQGGIYPFNLGYEKRDVKRKKRLNDRREEEEK